MEELAAIYEDYQAMEEAAISARISSTIMYDIERAGNPHSYRYRTKDPGIFWKNHPEEGGAF